MSESPELEDLIDEQITLSGASLEEVFRAAVWLFAESVSRDAPRMAETAAQVAFHVWNRGMSDA